MGLTKRNSRFYQNGIQAVGSVSEIVLFLSGFYLGKGLFVTAVILLGIRVVNKLIISELMYYRMKTVVREETDKGEV